MSAPDAEAGPQAGREPRLTGIKAAVFDAYGTLFDVHAPTARVGEALGDKGALLSQIWRQKQLEYSWLSSLMGRYRRFSELTADALDFALDAQGFSGGKAAALKQQLLDLYQTLDAYRDARDCLEALQQRGVKTAILSNGSPDMLDAAIRSAGIRPLLDAVLSVDRIKIFKPDPRVYQMVLDEFSLKAREVCFVSANGWDASGAASFGFQTVWLNRFAVPRERLPGEYQASVESLSALPATIAR